VWTASRPSISDCCFCPYLFCCSIHILLHTTSVRPLRCPSLTISRLAFDSTHQLLCHLLHPWQCPHLFLEIMSSEIFMAVILICLFQSCVIYFQTKDVLYRDIFSLREGVNSRILIITVVWLYSAIRLVPYCSLHFMVLLRFRSGSFSAW
jgi:hypothetical protein